MIFFLSIFDFFLTLSSFHFCWEKIFKKFIVSIPEMKFISLSDNFEENINYFLKVYEITIILPSYIKLFNNNRLGHHFFWKEKVVENKSINHMVQ